MSPPTLTVDVARSLMDGPVRRMNERPPLRPAVGMVSSVPTRKSLSASFM